MPIVGDVVAIQELTVMRVHDEDAPRRPRAIGTIPLDSGDSLVSATRVIHIVGPARDAGK
jgi:hypothetical protein